jgi:hypothetical protein
LSLNSLPWVHRPAVKDDDLQLVVAKSPAFAYRMLDFFRAGSDFPLGPESGTMGLLISIFLFEVTTDLLLMDDLEVD